MRLNSEIRMCKDLTLAMETFAARVRTQIEPLNITLLHLFGLSVLDWTLHGSRRSDGLLVWTTPPHFLHQGPALSRFALFTCCVFHLPSAASVFRSLVSDCWRRPSDSARWAVCLTVQE